MKKNLSFIVGLTFVLCISFFIFKKNKVDVGAVLPVNAKSEIVNPKTTVPFAKEMPFDDKSSKFEGKNVKNKNGICCEGKKCPVPLKMPVQETPKIENENRLEGLEDPDDVVSSGFKFEKIAKTRRYNEAVALEIERTKDPALGYVPFERHAQAMEQTLRMQEQMQREGAYLRGSITQSRWIERGPSNVGGRSRAILVDLNDKTGNTVFCGSATGGLFKNTNITSETSKWERVNDWLENLTMSSIAQDARNPQVMYIGTGDTDAADAVGAGILKSTDGGKTWRLLPTTISTQFQAVTSIIVTPDSSYVFAATFSGVFKSKDGGNTWQKVLNAKVYGLVRGKDGRFYASIIGNVMKSTLGGDLGTWTALGANSSFPNVGMGRIEVAVAPTNPDVVYIVGSVSGAASNVYRSNNGGNTWTTGTYPSWIDGCGGTPVATDFARGQANYDLCIAVDPADENIVWVGGVDMFRSVNGGSSWKQMSGWAGCLSGSGVQNAHADHHILVYDAINPSVLYSGNDGGVFRVTNSGSQYKISDRNNNLVTTLFYAADIHPDSASNHFIAGAQDNGTNVISGAKGIGVSKEVIGGDGFMCFVDQTEPRYQIGSLYYGRWGLSTDGGATFGNGANSNGGFFCPADLDNTNHILYAQTNSGDLWRWKIKGTTGGEVLNLVNSVLLSGGRSIVSNVFVDENVANRVYIGTNNGRVIRVDDAAVGTSLDKDTLLTRFTGNISSIDVERGNANHILVTISSYGVNSIQESLDGGLTWRNCDNGLPDMPVRWGIFNPNDAKQALIATDAGVWSTDLLNGESTAWIPPVPQRGTPVVRTDMLQYRKSDKMVLAATYGRGLWTSTVFAKPAAAIDYPPVSYLDVPIPFRGESSAAANNFLWKFADGTTDTLENTSKVYKQIGSSDVSLTINNDNTLIAKGKIKILPNLPTPYKTSTEGYAGNFDAANSDIHFGAWSASGSTFVRGKSSVFGKDGTHSGSLAYVLDPSAQTYQKGTLAYLHLPNYDMTQTGIYQFSFWANYDAQRGRDGLQVEYSLDKGLSWKTLGSNADPDWYNYNNNSVTDGAFAIGESMITGTADDWTRFKLNISNLAGNPNVAFRFVFKAANFAPAAGCAIDDVVITRYEGKNETAITSQSGAFTRAGNSIDIKFQTQPEYYAQTFDLEMSSNGRDWTKVESNIKATGGSTEELQEYNINVKGTSLDLYYFRVHSVNKNTAINYLLDFYSTPFVVKRNKDLPLAINKVFPSPFNQYIGITFTDAPNADVVYDLFDVAGRLISSQTVIGFTGIYQELKVPNLPKAVYLLRVKIGENKPESVKLFGGN